MNLTKREFVQVLGAGTLAGMNLGAQAQADTARGDAVGLYHEHEILGAGAVSLEPRPLAFGGDHALKVEGLGVGVDGLEPAESNALIEELTERMIQPEGTYTHQIGRAHV
mgnify:CR=1 FL=1